MSCGGHSYFFTSGALERIAANAGFKVLKNDSVGHSLTLGRLT